MDRLDLRPSWYRTSRSKGPELVSHRASWGILPQTPVFSLRSARCHWHTLLIQVQRTSQYVMVLWIFFPGGNPPESRTRFAPNLDCLPLVVLLFNRSKVRAKRAGGGVGPITGGIPRPPYIASLGALSLVELDFSSVLKISNGRTGPSHLPMCHLSWYTNDNVPSEARKRGSGGGSPRKYDDLLRSGIRATFFPRAVAAIRRSNAEKKDSIY
jgi:hypothetical protein